MIGYYSQTLFKPLIHSGLRLGLTLIITLMVISSPVFILVNPASAAPSFSTDGSTPGPSTIGQDGSDFTIQALSSLSARPTNNIVNTNSFYDVVFLTGTAGAIKTIQVTFPAGTTIPSSAFFNEAEGIGPGTASKSGQTITYTVTNAVNVPAGTKIRLEFSNINNPLPSSNYKVTVTTRNAANTPIDGPTQSTAYTMKQIGANVIADNSITSTKPSQSFMKSVILHDDAAGHALGWDPNGVATVFEIDEIQTGASATAFVNVDSTVAADPVCSASQVFLGEIEVWCTSPPVDGSYLAYTVINVPIIAP